MKHARTVKVAGRTWRYFWNREGWDYPSEPKSTRGTASIVWFYPPADSDELPWRARWANRDRPPTNAEAKQLIRDRESNRARFERQERERRRRRRRAVLDRCRKEGVNAALCSAPGCRQIAHPGWPRTVEEIESAEQPWRLSGWVKNEDGQIYCPLCARIAGLAGQSVFAEEIGD